MRREDWHSTESSGNVLLLPTVNDHEANVEGSGIGRGEFYVAEPCKKIRITVTSLIARLDW